jgi:polar amino acid transport system substrate-binding protein
MRIKSVISWLTTASVAAAFVLAIMPGKSHAEWLGALKSYEPTWDNIKRTGVVKGGCLPQLPYWSKTGTGGAWIGFGIEMYKNIAKELNVKYECVDTTWGTASLNIQSSKMHMHGMMQATPLRATAITFVGPVYNLGFMAINNKDFRASTWADYNKPTVKLAVQAGTSEELVARFQAPLARRLAHNMQSEAMLAVVADRADALVTTVINGIVAKSRNPGLGAFVIPTPLLSFPSYFGVRNEPDRRFETFLYWWAEWVRKRGQVEGWIKDSLLLMGVKKEEIPDKLYF